MVNKLRALCEKGSHTSKKHKKDIINSNPEVGSDTGEKNIIIFATFLQNFKCFQTMINVQYSY